MVKKKKERNDKKCFRQKEQGKNLQDQINEDGTGNLPEKEFRVVIIKMIQNHGNRMEKIQQTFNKDLEELKSKQTVMNNTITEIKNTLGTSLVAQWLRICLPMQRTWVQALIWEDPTCCGAAQPVCYNYWACALEPTSHHYWACVPQLLKPARLEPMLRNKRSHRSEEPAHCNTE